jgi:hypothetical protein
MAHLHSIYDSDLHFVIDPDTRVITNQMENKNSVIQFDHNSERFTFELPRYIEEHDMLTCNRVEVHYLNIEAKTGDQNIGIYEVQDLQVSPHDDKVVICSWLVSNNATKYAGTLNFVLRFACVTNQVDYIWNTAVFKNFAIQNGLYNSEPVVEQYADVLAEWYQSLFTVSADGVTNIQEARAAAIMAVDAVADERIADIEQAGSDVIASLPPEYLELVEDVAPPIVETATGEAIAITDSANRRLRGLTLYGKSTQDGTPTPEAPVEIESVENPVVSVNEQTLPVTRTLAGIPVASGGNYTDENGQQWVCDEVDFGRGVYVQRTLQRTISDFSGAVTAAPEYGHTEGYLNLRVHTRDKTGGYCDTFPYSASGHFPRFGLAGAMIYFTLEGEYTTEEWRERMTALSPAINVALKTPVETALTPEELAAYASLRSNYPNTSVLNDGGAGMAVAYVADTKLYIDRKIKEVTL